MGLNCVQRVTRGTLGMQAALRQVQVLGSDLPPLARADRIQAKAIKTSEFRA